MNTPLGRHPQDVLIMIAEERLKSSLGLYVPTLLLILVPVVLIAFLVRTQRGEVRNVTGTNLETAARTAALRIDQYRSRTDRDFPAHRTRLPEDIRRLPLDPRRGRGEAKLPPLHLRDR